MAGDDVSRDFPPSDTVIAAICMYGEVRGERKEGVGDKNKKERRKMLLSGLNQPTIDFSFRKNDIMESNSCKYFIPETWVYTSSVSGVSYYICSLVRATEHARRRLGHIIAMALYSLPKKLTKAAVTEKAAASRRRQLKRFT